MINNENQPHLVSLSDNSSMVFNNRNNNGIRSSPFCGFNEEDVVVPMSKQRSIPKIPFKVLDAPSLGDDFYLNLVDWSSRNDLVVGLSSCTYIWSASSSKVTKLHDFGSTNSVTSV